MYATPRFAFLTWIAMHNRLSTRDRMMKWGGLVNSACSLCAEPLETKNHMFFECSFSAAVWENLARRMMGNEYMNVWREIVDLISTDQNTTRIFTLKYIFQSIIHDGWMERKGRRHGKKPLTTATLIKAMENRFTSVQKTGSTRLRDGLSFWFSTGPDSRS